MPLTSDFNPAKLRDRVSLQEDQGTTTDDHGQPVSAWVTLATLWANVDDLQGAELFYAQQTVAAADSRVTLRYYAGLNPQMRFVHEGRTLSIVSVVDVDGMRRKMVCLCKREA